MTTRAIQPAQGGMPTGPRAVAERAAGIARFGYGPVEAEFLTAAALLGGYFLRRQFRAFAGVRRGEREMRLVQRAAGHGHLSVIKGPVHLHRLRGRSLYKAVGCEDPSAGGGRARRAVKQRLMALDYWICAPAGARFLLQPQDKVDHFAALGISPDSFPVAARSRKGVCPQFPGVLPIQLPGPACERLRFIYPSSGSGTSGLARHLDSCDRLGLALAARGIPFDWAVLADGGTQFTRLRRAVRAWLARHARDWSEHEYFPLRLAVDRCQWGSLTKEGVDRYVELSHKHSGPGVDRRYRRWVAAGASPRTGASLAEAFRHEEVLMQFDYAAADWAGA